MCGRYSFAPSALVLQGLFEEHPLPDDLVKSFNIAPSQLANVLVLENSALHLRSMYWGLVSGHTTKKVPNGKHINARVETVVKHPLFRDAYESRRCIIPADSFYEWGRIGEFTQAYRILRVDKALLFFAGIWERYLTHEGKAIDSFCILTKTPVPEIQDVHNRMPVVLEFAEQRGWLLGEEEVLLDLSKQQGTSSPVLEYYPVGDHVGNVSNNGIRLHDMVPARRTLFD
jgi:putative SOS response-associated peptidase YedK